MQEQTDIDNRGCGGRSGRTMLLPLASVDVSILEQRTYQPARDLCDGKYLRTITAKITGVESASRKPVAIGYIKAVFFKENMARHTEEKHEGADSLE